MSGEHPFRLYRASTGCDGWLCVASSLEASKDESDGFGSADDAEDDDDGLLSDNEMFTWCTYPFVTIDKKRE